MIAIPRFFVVTFVVAFQIKEAYDILSDPKRKKLYDQVGMTGLKLVESPQDVNPTELLKNFQVSVRPALSLPRWHEPMF